MLRQVTMGSFGFPMMADIIPEGRSGRFYIRHQTISREDAKRKRLLGAIQGDWNWRGFEAGTYCILSDDSKGTGMSGDIIMSDTYRERSTNYQIASQANGHVLIAGLGIGLILTTIVTKLEVESVTVIELEQDVINLVEPHIRGYLDGDSSKLRIIKADIFAWKPDRKYDVIYFDIWHYICGDNYPETKALHKKFKYVLNRQNSKCWIDSWLRWKFRDEWREADH